MSTVSLQELRQNPICPEVTEPESRPYGLCAGEFVVPDDFDAALPEDLLIEFEGQ